MSANDRRSSGTSSPPGEMAPASTTRPDDRCPSASDGALERPAPRMMPADVVRDQKAATRLAVVTGLIVAAAIGLSSTSGDTGFIVFGLIAVFGGFVHLGALVNLASRSSSRLSARSRIRWLSRLDRALAGRPLSAEARGSPSEVELVGPGGIIAQLTPRRGRRSVAFTASCAGLDGLTVTLERPDSPVADGAVQGTPRVSVAAFRGMVALLEGGARIEDGLVSGACAFDDLCETAERLVLLDRPSEGVEIPVAERPLVPMRTLAEGLLRNGALTALRVGSVGAAVALIARCNTLERTTIWSREIREGAYGAALVGLAVAVVALVVSRGAWTPFVRGASRLLWHARLAYRLKRRGLRLTWAHGAHRIYDPRDPRRSVEIAPLHAEWVFAAPIRGVEHCTLWLGDGPEAIAGLRISGDRAAAVIALTPEVRALVMPVLATGATIRHGRIEGRPPYDDLLDVALTHSHLFATAPQTPFDRGAAARQRMVDDPEARWRLACFDAALDTDPDEAHATLLAARTSGHPELRLVAAVLTPSAEPRPAIRVAPIVLQPLVASLGDGGTALVRAIAHIAARQGPVDDVRLFELGDCCPGVRDALVAAISGQTPAVEAVFVRWLGDAHDTAAVRIADALADWGTAAALPALAEAARRMQGARAGRLMRAERASAPARSPATMAGWRWRARAAVNWRWPRTRATPGCR